MSLMFTKEAVRTPPPASSLLSSTLAATGRSMPSEQPSIPAESSVRTHTSVKSLPSFSVAQVISGVLNQLAGEPLLGLTPDISRYDLRIAEDDGTVDGDFPSVDYNVPITSVGVDKFVLCEIATDKPVLRVSIPAQNVQLRVCESDSPPELTVTCYQPLAAKSATSTPAPVLASTSSSTARHAGGVDAISAALASAHVGVKREPSSPTVGPKQFIVTLRGVPATR